MMGITRDVAIALGIYQPKGGPDGMHKPSEIVEIVDVAPIDTTEGGNTVGIDAERDSGNPEGPILW